MTFEEKIGNDENHQSTFHPRAAKKNIPVEKKA
jgi:hypothetical protein